MSEQKNLNAFEEELNSILSPLQVLHNVEQPARVCDAIIRDIESLERKELFISNVDALAARLDLPSADIWRCFNSLIQLRDCVNGNKVKVSDLSDVLTRDVFGSNVTKAIVDFASSKPPYKFALANAPSKYPPFRSLQCRLQITRTAPEVYPYSNRRTFT